MKWSAKYEKKWILLSLKNSWDLEARLFNKCVVVAKNEKQTPLGFCVIEPRDLQKTFAAKILKRKSEDVTIHSFELFYPEFIKHRVSEYFSADEFNFLKSTPTPFVEIKTTPNHLSIRTKIRVVNVDDSPVLLKFLSHTLGEASWIELLGQVKDSTKAVSSILEWKPDLVTLDIQMPEMNGVQVLTELLKEEHFPVLMVSSLSLEDGSLVFEALNSGAFDYLQKPRLEDRDTFKEELLLKICMAVEGRNAQESLKKLNKSKTNKLPLSAPAQYDPNLVWCFGSSTGGTQALTEVFRSLPGEIPPTLVVQHIPPVFSKSFAESLDLLCPFTVKEAEHGDVLKANFVYVAPGAQQMSIEKVGTNYQIVIKDDEPVNRFKPSVDYLFLRLAEIKELSFVAGIMTGMGKDGAKGLLALKNAGALTFAQDEATSAVYGMPRAAYEIGAVDSVCPLDQIAEIVLQKSTQIHKPKKIAA